MEENESEKIIGKMIRKRKEENEAFLKILSAMESKPKEDAPKQEKKKKK